MTDAFSIVSNRHSTAYPIEKYVGWTDMSSYLILILVVRVIPNFVKQFFYLNILPRNQWINLGNFEKKKNGRKPQFLFCNPDQLTIKTKKF